MVSGALASGSLSALCVQAASLGSGRPEPSPGLQGPCPSSVARPTPDRISHWGAWETWPTGSVSRDRGVGGRREVPTAPEVGAAG